MKCSYTLPMSDGALNSLRSLHLTCPAGGGPAYTHHHNAPARLGTLSFQVLLSPQLKSCMDTTNGQRGDAETGRAWFRFIVPPFFNFLSRKTACGIQ